MGSETYPFIAFVAVLWFALHYFIQCLVNHVSKPTTQGWNVSLQAKLREPAKRDKMPLLVISFIFSSIISVLSARVLLDPEPGIINDDGIIYGYSPRAQIVVSISVAFFFWNLAVDHDTVSNTAHHLACLVLYSFGPNPTFHWMACICLLWEASTPFLCIRTALIMLGETKNRFFDINNALFGVTFLVMRIGIGVPTSLWWWTKVFHYVWDPKDDGPHYLVGLFMIGNIGLTFLNLLWSYKILSQALFPKPRPANNEKST